jgi:Flp pilus assembly protein TadD
MSLRQFLLVVALLGCAELAVFEWRFHDLRYLARPVAALAREPGERFVPQASHALARPTLTRAKLETIAQAAAARNDRDVAIRALTRLAREYPSDARVHIRLADALREAGRLEEANQAYQQAIAAAAIERR